MQFKDISGQEQIKNQLVQSAKEGRVSHAQLFYGPEGNGALALALAYAQYLSCENPSENDSCGQCAYCRQYASFSFPDIHFVYPVAKTTKIKDKPLSDHFLDSWSEIIRKEQYFGLFRWFEFLGIENKQAQISVYESAQILKKLQLKSYSGGYKFMIIWIPERMNSAAANKLLKILEEPPQKTLFLLVSENADDLLQTITSRCQKLYVPKYSTSDIQKFLLEEEGLDESSANVIARLADGNMAYARSLAERSEAYRSYALRFSSWVRSCFKADLKQILEWVEENARFEREKLKDFLAFSMEIFRESLSLNFIEGQVTHQIFKEIQFELDKFAPFVNLNNIPKISSAIDKAHYDISRNGNPKVILADLSLNMARYLRISH